MEAIEAFFGMGGYARFVWPAYAIAALAMAGLAIASLRSLRAREAELKLLEREKPRRARRSGDVGNDA